MLARKDFYTYAGAKQAIVTIKIKSRDDYSIRYREDPRLPSNPHKVYAKAGWSGWPDFLGKTAAPLYATFEEAQLAAQALGITSQPDYRKRYLENPRLPCHPESTYATIGWTNWFQFLGKSCPSLYPTYTEAKLATQKLAIKTRKEYEARYQQDPRLPSNPNQVYAGAGWVDWFDFMGKSKKSFYATYSEAQTAAQALRITSGMDYRARYQEDPKLPSGPSVLYADSGWTNWSHFLGSGKRSIYGTYAEAQSAAQLLGIQSIREYNQRYIEDSKLPSNPVHAYAKTGWTSWIDFLGKERRDFYPTLAESHSAVISLGIKTQPEYSSRYHEDPRLPAAPNIFYANSGWIDWYYFLGNERRDLYPTYAEAQAAAQALGIKTAEQYKLDYRIDARLPASPNNYYASTGWIDWPAFLGSERRDLYPTLEEAKTAAKALGIKTSGQYKLTYRQDARLPSMPEKLYANAGWTDWYDFLDKDKPRNLLSEFENISRDIGKWLENETNLPVKIRAMNIFLAGYLKPQGCPDDTKFLLLRSNPINTDAYRLLIETQAESRKKAVHSAITSFYKWALNEYCTDTEAEERIILPECRNPFDTIFSGTTEFLQGYRPSQSTKPPLGYEYILRARKFLVPDGEDVLLKRPSLKDYPHLQVFFDSRIDWIDIDESRIEKTDPNCIWRVLEGAYRDTDENKRKKVKVYQVWSPVRFIALYSLLRYPLRGQQFLWLDSGETDDEIIHLDPETGDISWKENNGPLAGKGSRKSRRQAMVQRGYKGNPKLFVNTNKTGRVDGGYDVEWIPDDLLYWLVLLRDWQIKYNPLVQPTPWLSLAMPTKINEKILKARGTQTFLFRTDTSGQPLSTSSAYVETLPKLLHQIQRAGENLAEENLGTGPRYISPYTPHSLRVSLITAFIADGDAPIHIISKLVGHASLVMTIYYIKMNSDQMRRFMGEAEKRAAKLVQDQKAELIRTRGLHPLRSQLIATDGNRLLIDSDVPNSACVVFDCGICPMSAASCHIGGEIISERKSDNYFAPVEAGYLGQKNCPRCRFFVTGIPFLGGLVSLANELSLEIYTESGRYQVFASEVERLEQEHYDDCLARRPDMKTAQRKTANANMQQSGAKLDGLLTDYAAVNQYVQGCLKLIKESEHDSEDDSDIRLIAAGDLSDIGVRFEESRTYYHLLAEICQNATIYQSTNPSRAVPLIAQAIDQMAENNNLKPAMFSLTDEQKLIVANELNRLLLHRLGSWERIDDLFSGDLMLLDVDAHEPTLTRISTQIQKLLSHATTHQIIDTVTK